MLENRPACAGRFSLVRLNNRPGRCYTKSKNNLLVCKKIFLLRNSPCGNKVQTVLVTKILLQTSNELAVYIFRNEDKRDLTDCAPQ